MTGTAHRIEVVAAVIRNPQQQVLLARRADALHQGGLWEFPGGKREAGESEREALGRELREELGIELIAATPLIRLDHDYGSRRVALHFFEVTRFRGTPRGLEGQPLEWANPTALHRYPMPAADQPVVNAIRLPHRYLITGPLDGEREAFLCALERSLQRGIRLVQLRLPGVDEEEYYSTAAAALALCRRYAAELLLNASPEMVDRVGADGIHLPAHRLRQLRERPLGGEQWVAASCHQAEELAMAVRLGVDFALLSPVLPTASHPGASPLGWERFEQLIYPLPLPVFALGGMSEAFIEKARHRGGHGIAAIRGLWG